MPSEISIMLAVIKYSNMLDIMEKRDGDGNPVPFSLAFISFNRVFLNKVKRQMKLQPELPLMEIVKSIFELVTEVEKIGIVKKYENTILAKNMTTISNTSAAREPIVTARANQPKQLRSAIRRLYLPKEMKIKNCYTRLIITFNGLQVIY